MVDRVPGAVGAVFADWEGESVDHFATIAPVDIQLVGAHFGVVLTQVNVQLASLGAGRVDEIWIEGERLTVFVRRVNERYYVVLQTRHDVHLANASRELELGARRLLGEM
jgi:predicted regulator of Ras-like GTPase activity (Roadblock/LC7/MglB family)